MAAWQDLKFDKMAVDTKLAQEYFHKKKKIFTCLCDGNPIDHTNTSDYIFDRCNNRIYLLNGEELKVHKKDWQDESIDSSTLAESVWQLAKKIEQNSELFCQLICALQNCPKDDVNKDVQLLIKKCLHASSLLGKYQRKIINIGMTDWLVIAGAPFYYLSRAVSDICIERRVVIQAHPQAAAVCTLFIELCQEVGLQNISLHLMRPEDMPSGETPKEGCIGIVSETADMDSAVHAFVSSTTQYPWRMNKILIQENVYEEFQRALQWKCNENVNEKSHEPYLKRSSTDTQVADGKIFLVDYVGVGNIKSKLQPVIVSAYRTNKELINMLSKNEEPFVSLWCTDSAHANEVALSISSPCVWINSYAVFNGSPRVSSAVPLHKPSEEIKLNKNYGDEKLEKMQIEGLKFDLEKRREVMLEVLRKYIANTTDDTKQIAVMVQILLTTQTPDSIEVNKNDMWICVQKPVGLAYVNKSDGIDYFADAIASIVYGNRLIIYELEDYMALVKELQNAGLLIIKSHALDFLKYNLYKTKAVYSNFGTIFAN